MGGQGGVALLAPIQFRIALRMISRWSAQVDVVLRNVTFTALPGCNASHLASPFAFPGIATRTCGELYTRMDGHTSSVCTLVTEGACVPHHVSGAPLTGVTCSCPGNAFVNPDIGDPMLAPYTPSGGCIEPLMLSSISFVDDQVLKAATIVA